MNEPKFSIKQWASNTIRSFADTLGAASADGRMLSQAYRSDDSTYGMDITPYNPDELIVKKGYGIIDQMRHDDQVRSVMTMKKFARLAPGWDVRAASSSKSDIQAAEFCKWALERLPGTFDTCMLQLMTSLDYGFSISEIVWDIVDDAQDKYKGKIGLKGIKTRRPHRFDFFQDEFGNLLPDGVAQEKEGGQFDRMPSNKFILYTYQREFDNLYGISDYRSFYREWWIKTVILKFYAMWLERFPFPPTIGWYPPGTSNDNITDLESILESLQVSSVATLPMGIVIDQLQIPSTGARSYETALKIMNKAITRGALVPDLLGYTDTSTRGSFALGQKHFDVFLWILIELGRDISSTINEQLLTQLSQFNFSGQVPIFELINPQDDLASRANVLQILTNSGAVDPKEDWVRDYLSVPKPSSPYVKRYTEKKSSSTNVEEDNEEDDNEDEEEFRDLTKFEEAIKFDPQKTEDRWERWEQEITKSVSDIIWTEIDKLLTKIPPLYENEDSSGIRRMKMNVSGIQEEIESKFVEIYLESKLIGLEEIESSIFRRLEFNESSKFWSNEIITFQSPPKPEEFIKKYRGRIPLTKKEWSRLKAKMRNRAFTMAGQINRDVISKFQELIFTSIDDDWTLNELLEQVEKKGVTYTGRAWNIDPGKRIKPWHTELIFRNQIGLIYNDARKALYNNRDVSRFVPAIQYSAILDTRTRKKHEDLDKKIYAKNDPIWKEIYPPNGHNCRCVTIPVTSNMEFEISESTNIKADEGFGRV